MFPNIGPQSPAPDLAYLNLNGSLSWLSPLDSDSDSDSDSNDYSDSDIEEHKETYFQEPTIKAGPLKKLMTQAERLRLTFPPSSLTLVISEDLQRRIPTTTETQSSLGSLMKCSPETDRNAGGYVSKFLSGYEASWTANLYLDTMGQHCVSYSGEDIGAEESDEDEDGQEEWTGDAITLQALDFEEYMYHIWINELGWATLFKGKDLSEAQRAYLERIQEE